MTDRAYSPKDSPASIGWLGIVAGTMATWILLLIVRQEILTSPPLWDYGIALWPEGITLNRRGFDLTHHLFHEPHWHAGGTAIYRWTIIPLFIGLLYRILRDPPLVFLAYHSLVLLTGAAIAVLVYGRLRRAIGTGAALMIAAGVLTCPLFSTQLDMLSMETFASFWVLISALCLGSCRWQPAIWAAVAGFFVKNSGYFTLLGLLTVFVMLLLWSLATRNRNLTWQMTTSIATVGIVFFALVALVFGQEGGGIRGFFSSSFRGLILPFYWCPELIALAAYTTAAALLWAGWFLWKHFAPADDLRIHPAASGLDGDVVLLLFCGVMFAGVYLSNAFVLTALPRYLVMCVPLIYLAFALLLLTPGPLRTFNLSLLGLLLLFNVVNWSGSLLPSIEAMKAVDLVHEREGSALERSREYLVDHRSNILAMKALDASWNGEPVLAGAPFNHFLAMPELGYVSRPIDGYTVNGITQSVGGMKSLNDLRNIQKLIDDAPARAILVYSENPFYQHYAVWSVPKPGDRDEILYDDHFPSPLIVYRKRFDETRTDDYEQRQRFYSGQLRYPQ